MILYLFVEGDSDKILLEGQLNWFNTLGLVLNIVPTNGKLNMIKKARAHYKMAIYNGADLVVFLPDQHGDKCALVTRNNIGVDSFSKAVTIVAKRELEAWVLADGQCVKQCTGIQYAPCGQTDSEIDPKRNLQCQLKRKLGYMPASSVEIAKIVSPHFSIDRAANNNTSVKRFKKHFENISPL